MENRKVFKIATFYGIHIVGYDNLKDEQSLTKLNGNRPWGYSRVSQKNLFECISNNMDDLDKVSRELMEDEDYDFYLPDYFEQIMTMIYLGKHFTWTQDNIKILSDYHIQLLMGRIRAIANRINNETNANEDFRNNINFLNEDNGEYYKKRANLYEIYID